MRPTALLLTAKAPTHKFTGRTHREFHLAIEHHLAVSKTARFYTLGDPDGELREVWFVCHGYGQLARYFLRHFEQLQEPGRLIIAPEALSRFYLGDPAGSHAHARVAATWMTREDRLNEIQDYVAYLDGVYDWAFGQAPRHGRRVVALGFSQGVATVCRWAALGRAEMDELVVWAQRVPPDLDLAQAAARFQRLRLTLVHGTADPAMPRPAVAEELARWDAHGLRYAVREYQGGHVLDQAVLRAIANAGDSGPTRSQTVG